MCMVGRVPGSSSNVGTCKITCGWAGCLASRCVPQAEQKRRSLAGEDSKAESLGEYGSLP